MGSAEKKSKKSKKEKKEEVVEEVIAEPEVEKKKSKKDKKDKKRKAEEEPVAEPEPEAKKEKKAKKSKKEKKEKKEPATEAEPETAAPAEPKPVPEAAVSAEDTGSCKCFLGNLSFKIDDDITKEFFKDCGEIEEIYWVTDKETGKFYGTGFITFTTPEAARKACALAGTDLLERPIKVELAKPKAGAGGATPKKSARSFEKSEKQAGCVTCFLGNLSYDIDDDKCKEFFKECGEVAKIRWLTDRETGDFKGCGFIEFFESDATDKAVALSGQDLLGRAIRVDFAKSK